MDSQSRSSLPMNRNAVISMVAAILTVLSFCTAVAPIPLTGWVCYPAAFACGLVALVTGMASLAQIRSSQEEGRSYAIIGITVGALSIVGTACAVALGIAFFPRFVSFLKEGGSVAQATWQRVVEFFMQAIRRPGS